MSTSLKSLSGRGYVPVDKIMMRQKERKVKNTYEVLKKQEMKKQHHTDEEEKTQKKAGIESVNTFFVYSGKFCPTATILSQIRWVHPSVVRPVEFSSISFCFFKIPSENLT